MLSLSNVKFYLPRVVERMGRGEGQLKQLVGLLSPDGTVSLDTVLCHLYPSDSSVPAQAKLRQLRLLVAVAATSSGLVFCLAGDKKTRTPAKQRSVWFEGDDPTEEKTERWGIQNLEGPERSPQIAMQFESSVCVIHAEEDNKLATELVRRLEPLFKSGQIKYWWMNHVLPGENCATEQAHALRGSDLTLQLWSPDFHARHLEKAVSERVVPVMLKDLGDEPSNKIVEFRHEAKSFAKSNKDDFARGLYRTIRAVLAKSHNTLTDGFSLLADDAVHFVPGRASRLDLNREIGPPVGPAQNQFDSLEFLLEWVLDPKAPLYCALFGELGIGKTTTAKAFARNLLHKRKVEQNGRDFPLPIFLDLRLLGDTVKSDPNLDDVVRKILDRDWKGGPRSTPPLPEEVYRLVEEGALVIFDGLDEVLVHLTASQGKLFTRQLFRILPPKSTNGRLLITCRTQYFRTFLEQSTHFTTEGRDGINADHYRALVLMPFDEVQVRIYLKHTLPHCDLDQVLEFLRSVHNLPELARTPYTLSLITRQYAQIERLKAEGRSVSGVTLYRLVVQEWLLRDEGKHQLTPHHKQMLMEHIAADLTRSGARSWDVDRLEDWLMAFLMKNPVIDAHYVGQHRELLKEDLRTATFLTREGYNLFRFAHSSLLEFFLASYLHRALIQGRLECWQMPGVSPETFDFLGQLLLDSDESDRSASLRTLERIRDCYRKEASELAFAYCLRAFAREYPAPSMDGFQLAGADLSGLRIAGSPVRLLSLRQLDLRGARLHSSIFRHCNLAGSDFKHSTSRDAEFIHCDFAASQWQAALLEGVTFRRCDLQLANFTSVQCDRGRWLSCRLNDAIGLPVRNPDAFFALCEPASIASAVPDQTSREVALSSGRVASVNNWAWSPDGSRIVSASDDYTLRLWDTTNGECLRTLSGHAGFVNSCAWSPDGNHIVSASDDFTLRLWDTTNGECLSILSGHAAPVNSCAWSPDGSRIVSASDDYTLRLWDASSRESFRTFFGHADSVNSCAWSPDGTRIVSGSNDCSVRLWDASSGEFLRALSRLTAPVYSCAWSPDGTRIVSASSDGALRIRNAVGGECILFLFLHAGSVNSCAWSPDGSRIVSASDDYTLRLWDTTNGECLRTLSGHAGFVNSCAWSPDGSRIVSASSDGTLRLWDASSGESLVVLGHYRDTEDGPAWLSFSSQTQRVLACGPEAWRNFDWIVPDPKDGRPVRLPAEAFGPLPVSLLVE